MLACVFWNHVNNLYTNTLYTVYIYNHTSHVGWWQKIFFLQCLYSKLLFLHRAQWPGPQWPVSLGCGVPINTPHYLIHDYLPYTRSLSSVCLHMWRTANLLPAFCFSFSPSLYCLSERFPPSFLFPTMHHGLYQGAQEVKRCSDVKAHSSNSVCNLLIFYSLLCASLTLLYQPL